MNSAEATSEAGFPWWAVGLDGADLVVWPAVQPAERPLEAAVGRGGGSAAPILPAGSMKWVGRNANQKDINES